MIPLCAGAAVWVFLLLPGNASAQGVSNQTADNPASRLMRPVLDGDPLEEPRFRSPRNVPRGSDTSRFTPVKNYDYQPAIGAGTTGFDSTGARRKTKSVPQKGKPAVAAAPPPAADQPAPRTLPPVPLVIAPVSQPVPPATLPETARPSRNQLRPGAGSPLAAVLVPDPAAIPLRRTLVVEENPFAATGIQVGSFVLRPAIEVTRGYDTNPARGSNNAGSWLWLVSPELLVNSNWARHELTANVRGTYTSFDTFHSLDRPSMDAKVNGRVDVTSLSRIDLEGRFLVGTDRPGSPNIQADLARLPIFTTLGGTAGFGQRINHFEVTLKGGFDRTIYRVSNFMNGLAEPNVDRNYNQYSTQLRTSYEVLPGVKPFVEVGGDIRHHDLSVDRFGLQRDSQGLTAKAGSSFELSSKFTGEVAAGYLTRTYKDPTLPDLNGVLFDASLLWTASALTTAKLTASTTANETTVVGVAGIFTREVGLQVDHAFRRWLIGTLRFTRAVDVYDGSSRVDYRYGASGILTYMLTRNWHAKAEYRQEWRNTDTPGQDYTANIWLVGLRFQR